MVRSEGRTAQVLMKLSLFLCCEMKWDGRPLGPMLAGQVAGQALPSWLKGVRSAIVCVRNSRAHQLRLKEKLITVLGTDRRVSMDAIHAVAPEQRSWDGCQMLRD